MKQYKAGLFQLNLEGCVHYLDGGEGYHGYSKT